MKRVELEKRGEWMEDEAGFDRWNEFKAGGIDQPVCGFFPEMEGEVGQKRAVNDS